MTRAAVPSAARGAVPSAPARVLVLVWPDWPVVAAGIPSTEPAAVLHANRVVAATAAARAEGVVPGMRRRVAQARCPGLEVVEHDLARDARSFEPVLSALGAITPFVEALHPGRTMFATRGPSRGCGGDDALAHRTLAVARAGVAARTSAAVSSPAVGISEGRFAATLAAHRALDEGTGAHVVAPGGAPAFLAPLPVSTLGTIAPVELLARLGIHRLGELAALPAAMIADRFGAPGALAHRLASGGDDRPASSRPAPPDLVEVHEIDPPADRADRVAFVGKALADRLHDRLSAQGLACTRIVIEVETEHGEHRSRVWRHEGALSAAAIAERVRWQLEGWLQATDAPTAGITVLRLVPDEVLPDVGRQLGFWGGQTRVDERAVRALARVAGMVGREAVLVPERRGGRGPAEQLALVPIDTVDVLDRIDALDRPAPVGPPWPGRIPPPWPAVVPVALVPAEVVAADGTPVGVSGRGLETEAPARLSVDGGHWREIVGWAGPWCVEERWWDARAHRRRARFQVVTELGVAHLLCIEGGRWWVEATYD